MKQIILIRHTDNGITDRNKPNDNSITNNGVSQAKEIKAFLQNFEFETMFCSLYKRSIETAEIINSERKLSIIKSGNFNEYFIREDGKGVESCNMAESRAMSKLYSIFDQYESIVIVAHSSINQTILRSITNMQYQESLDYYLKFGETHILRYDYKLGDKNWKIVNSFTPKQ